MCLILFAWQAHPEYPLIVASNRDEFYARRTRPAAWWGQTASILAGRDDEAGGTWLGINRAGRFAMLTNVRTPSERNPHAPSRGLLVVSALQSPRRIGGWADENAHRMPFFNGFNLIVGEPFGSAVGARRGPAQLHYLSNRPADAWSSTGRRVLAGGIYGVSNAALDTPWPKVTRAVARFACQVAQRVDPAAFLRIMADREVARDHDLPATGIPLDWERALSAVQIRANGYGTRTTTVLTVRNDGAVAVIERSFDPERPEAFNDRRFEFMIDTRGVRTERLDFRRDDGA